MSEIQAEDINFQTRVYNGNTVTINKLKEDLKDGIIIWTTGSGASPSGNSHYKCGIELHGHLKVVTGDAGTYTANQVAILGVTECIGCINKPSQVYLVSAMALGLKKGLSGIGANKVLVQELLGKILKKGCQLTEVHYQNGAGSIKRYLREQAAPDGSIKKTVTGEKKRTEEKKALRTLSIDEIGKKPVWNGKYLRVLKNAVNEGKNIVITGDLSSGKSTLLMLMMKMCSESELQYSCIDEIEAKEDMEFMQRKLHTGAKAVFTTYKKDFLLENIPDYQGIIVELVANPKHKMNIYECAFVNKVFSLNVIKVSD